MKELTKKEFIMMVMNLTGEEFVRFRTEDHRDRDESVKVKEVTIGEIEEYLSQRDDHFIEIGDVIGINKVSGVYHYYRY